MQADKACLHGKRIDDEITGSEVCLECGLVLDTIFSEQIPRALSFPSYSWGGQEELGTNPSKIVKAKYKAREHLEDICARLHIEGEENRHLAFQYFCKLKKRIGSKRRVKQEGLLAFSIWETLNILQAPRHPGEVAAAVGVNPKIILKVQKSLDVSSTYCPPVFYVDRICGNLFLNTFITEVTRSVVSLTFNLGSFKPESVVGACILLILKQLRSEKKDKYFPEINLMYLCSFLGVSSSSINKVQKAIDSTVVKNAIHQFTPSYSS